MDSDLLSDHLARLHEELKNVRDVDPRSNQLLSEILKDIQRLRDAQSGAAPPAHASLAERLESLAVRFEAEHPTLAASARRLIDLLGKAGL
jgi:hypothetical protein